MLIGHQRQWEFFKKKFETGQLAHAYLFAGQEGVGKRLFADEFAQFIECVFPDLMSVESEAGEIPIKKIREVQKFLAYKPYYGNFKIVIVDNAHLMNQEAQSCFLKTLEEPKGNTILFLISSKPHLILSTIRSRCQMIKFFKPKNLPVNQKKIIKDQEILKKLLSVVDADFSEKFKYVKSLNFDEQSVAEILTALQNHYRERLLSDFSDQKAKKVLEMSEEIGQKLMFTNASPKLALEILLMGI